jgi:hypothetical protein
MLPHIEHNSRRQRLNWFQRQRDFFIRQIFSDFFFLLRSFQEMYGLYCRCRTSKRGNACCLLAEGPSQEKCSIWEQLSIMVGTEVAKGPLWLLKDLCQQIWPEGSREQELDIGDSLIEWLIGSIFHEAVKLKEDVHILNSYASAAFWLPRNTPISRLTEVIDRKGLIQRVAVDVMRQMEHLALLFGQTSNMLRTMLPTLAGNSLLVRFLVEREDMVAYLWSEELDSIFSDMFSGQAAQGFCAAGKSYMSGQWYTRALIMYRRAVELDSSCHEAAEKVDELQLLIQQTSGFLGAA